MITKEDYLKKRQALLDTKATFKREAFCFTCHRIQQNCLCNLIKSFETKTHFVILMHPMEAKKEKMGTGRISLATLKNSQLIVGIDFTEDVEVNGLLNDPRNHCMVLYPGEKSLNISKDDVSTLQNLGEKRLVVFLIDGTWPCAKKMMRLSKNIHSLARISFTATHESIFIIKEQPATYCLSTLESIHFFLTECDRRGLESLNSAQDNLIEVFKTMVDIQVQCALDPSLPSYRKSSGGYTKKRERVKSKKWGSDRIVFKG